MSTREGGKRKRTVEVVREPWHVDIFDFLDL
jgi:hypothetical protein